MSSFRPGPKSMSEAAKLNQMEQDVENLGRMMGETPIQVDFTGGGPPIIRLRDSGNLPVLISGFTSGTISGTLIYSWYEQTFDSSGIRVPKPNGSSGDFTDNPMFEVNNTDLSSVLTGGATIQTWATRRGLCEGFGTAYEFQYQVTGGTSATNLLNLRGFNSGGIAVRFSGIGFIQVSGPQLYLTSGAISGSVFLNTVNQDSINATGTNTSFSVMANDLNNYEATGWILTMASGVWQINASFDASVSIVSGNEGYSLGAKLRDDTAGVDLIDSQRYFLTAPAGGGHTMYGQYSYEAVGIFASGDQVQVYAKWFGASSGVNVFGIDKGTGSVFVSFTALRVMRSFL